MVVYRRKKEGWEGYRNGARGLERLRHGWGSWDWIWRMVLGVFVWMKGRMEDGGGMVGSVRDW